MSWRRPQAVAHGDKLFGVENVERIGPYAIASHPTQLPLDLGSRALKVVRSVRLRVGDDLGAAHRDGRLDRAVLTLVFGGVQPGDSIGAQMNGQRLSRSDTPVNGVGWKRRLGTDALGRGRSDAVANLATTTSPYGSTSGPHWRANLCR